MTAEAIAGQAVVAGFDRFENSQVSVLNGDDVVRSR